MHKLYIKSKLLVDTFTDICDRFLQSKPDGESLARLKVLQEFVKILRSYRTFRHLASTSSLDIVVHIIIL